MISPKLHDVLARCIGNPQHFFNEISKNFSGITGGIAGAFRELYHKDKGESAELLSLYRRFELCSFYLLTVKLGYHTGDRWCRNAASQLAKEIKTQYPLLDSKESDIKGYLDEYV